MNTDWIIVLFEEAGLSEEIARRAGTETLARILRRQRPMEELTISKTGAPFSTHLVRDPLVSLARILGLGDERLPFIDDDGHLSTVSFAEMLVDTGMDPVVAMAYAKVMHAAFEPVDLYQPIWELLGREGDVSLEELGKMDFEPLRTAWAEFEPGREGDLSEARSRVERIRRARGPKST